MSEGKKLVICRRFDKAAATYDNYASVQQKSAAILAQLLPARPSTESILEIGCGTGNYTGKLAGRYPQAGITAIDFAEAMIKQAKKKCRMHSNIVFVCNDGEQYLQTNKQKFDIITSNATIQWFTDLPKAFTFIAQSLNQDGVFLASIFGPRTLHELSAAVGEVFSNSVQLPAAQFADGNKIGQLLKKQFHSVRSQEFLYEQNYSSLEDMLRYIKNTGIGGFQPGLPMLTKERRKRLAEWLQLHGGFRGTYQVFFITAALPENTKH